MIEKLITWLRTPFVNTYQSGQKTSKTSFTSGFTYGMLVAVAMSLIGVGSIFLRNGEKIIVVSASVVAIVFVVMMLIVIIRARIDRKNKRGSDIVVSSAGKPPWRRTGDARRGTKGALLDGEI